MVTKIRVKELQTIWDIALQEYGSVSGVKQLMDDNPEINFQTLLQPGQIIKIISEPVNKDVRDFYKNNNIFPVSGEKDDALPYDFNNDFNNDFN